MTLQLVDDARAVVSLFAARHPHLSRSSYSSPMTMVGR